MHLVVGLGNPGERYARTRHNVAWQVLDRLGESWRASPAPGADQSATEEVPSRRFVSRRARVGDRDVELMRPLTFMNESGVAIRSWWLERGEAPEALLVVADDIWLPVGMLRLRARGSSGGHRGFESVEAALGTRDFARLRIGVGAAEHSERLEDHVLAPFASEELPKVDEAIREAADAVECWLTDGIEAAMNRFNRRVPKEVDEP